MYVLQRFRRINVKSQSHLLYPLGPERVLCVYNNRMPLEAAIFKRPLYVHSQLVHYLGFSASELAKHFGYGLCFEAPTHKLVQSLSACCEFLHVFSSLH